MTFRPQPFDYNDYDVDLKQIFIARDDQIAAFDQCIDQWEQITRVADPDQPPTKAISTPENKLQGLVVLLYGHGGFGKTTLLKHYLYNIKERNRRLLPGQSYIFACDIVDWQYELGNKYTLFNLPSDQLVDADAYFRLLCLKLSERLNKAPYKFKEYQKAVKAVAEVKKAAIGTLDSITKGTDEYASVRKWGIEGIVFLAGLVTPPSIANALDNQSFKNVADEGTKLAAQKVSKLLRDRLGNKLDEYMESHERIGLALGRDLFNFAKDWPLLIFFDTYEEIDEGDDLLRIVMSAAGPRVGWVIAGRDDLWLRTDESERYLAVKDGYESLVGPGLGLPIHFTWGSVGAFTAEQVKDYFMQVHQMAPLLAEVKDDEAKRIWDVTQGIPLAVKLAAELYQKTANLDIITKKGEGEGDGYFNIVHDMVTRYMLHITEESDRLKLYGLAMLRRTNQRYAVAKALELTSEQKKSGFKEELYRLRRRYSFIVADKYTDEEQSLLHQEVRHFLRLSLLEEKDRTTEIEIVNESLREAHEKELIKLEKGEKYKSLRVRLEDEKWVGIYLDITEQQFWLHPRVGLRDYALPLMLAIAPYNRSASREVIEIGKFFIKEVEPLYRQWWEWAKQGFKFPDASEDERRNGLQALTKVVDEHDLLLSLPSFVVKDGQEKIEMKQNYRAEVKAALWWELGTAYRGRDDRATLVWYEKALNVLNKDSALKSAIAETCWDIAYKLYEEKKPAEERISFLDKAIQLVPDYVSAYNSRGIAYHDLKKYEQAIKDYDTALKLDPKYVYVYSNRGNSYAALKKYDRAIEDYNVAIQLDRKLAYAYHGRGNVYVVLKDFKQAIKDFDLAIRLDPRYVNAYNSRGHLYRKLKDYKRAMENFDRAIALDPLLAYSYSIRGHAYVDLKQEDLALKDFNRAIELDPELADAYAGRGRAYTAYKSPASVITNFDHAMTDFNHALKLDPSLDEAYIARGLLGGLHGAKDDLSRAMDDLNYALKLNPNSAEAYLIRGTIRAFREEYAEAISDLGQAMQEYPDFAVIALAHMMRGSIHIAQEEYPEAITDYDQAILLLGKQIEAHLEWSKVYHPHNYQQVTEEYKRSIELQVNANGMYVNMGLAHLWQKNTQQAQANYSYAYALDPKDINAGWMAEWIGMSKERPGTETANRLEKIAEGNPEDYLAYACRAVALGLRNKPLKDGLNELERAIELGSEDYGPYFWQGMFFASYYPGRYQKAIKAIDKALELELPPVLLTPLYWLEKDRSDFFEQYARPLLEKYGV